MNVKDDIKVIQKTNNDYHSIGAIIAFSYDRNSIGLIQGYDKQIKNYLKGESGIVLSRYSDVWHNRVENIDFLTKYTSTIIRDKNKLKATYDDWKQTQLFGEDELAELTTDFIPKRRRKVSYAG